MPSTDGITIRTAEPEDLPEVYALVKQLAVFEKEPDEPTVNLDRFSRDFRDLYRCFVAESGGAIVGIALYFWGYSTWKGKMLYLDDLIVDPAFRRRGIGSMLFNRLVQLARDEDAGQMRWQVLDWNEPAIAMYERTGAVILKDWWTCKLEKPAIEAYSPL